MEDLSPKQIKFLESYLDIKSETFGNAYQSALKAGYSDEYAQNMTGQCPNWLSENISDAKLLLKAEKNINKLLDQDDDLKVKADLTKFVAGRLGKKKWSERQELSGPNGESLVVINGIKMIQPNANENAGNNIKTDSEAISSLGETSGQSN